MSAKKLVQAFYKSDALIDPAVMQTYLHPEVKVEWNSSKGPITMNYEEIIAFTTELSKAYVRTKVRMSHILQDGDTVAARYSHFVKTIENPREEMLLAHFFVIWEVKDDKLFRGFQMSQVS
ncbi:nuclear transport factor 2 family protein [Flavobacterium sp.]|uniref:nuclear transport factor 2 family protein n=1 Tax=Flavobacterium sp. TaxID=239 RepID=UPI0026377398|nr:nuclear transport factor 2 family protein [Flavobacterium sp.]